MGMFTALNLLQFWLFALAEVIPAALADQTLGHQSGARIGPPCSTFAPCWAA
ncbi:MAG: hypothetical protein MZV63_19405 [Marinilabiliales bacterium]|nr:hypothetical protein [Marinilabiliales bacterium]